MSNLSKVQQLEEQLAEARQEEMIVAIKQELEASFISMSLEVIPEDEDDLYLDQQLGFLKNREVKPDISFDVSFGKATVRFGAKGARASVEVNKDRYQDPLVIGAVSKILNGAVDDLKIMKKEIENIESRISDLEDELVAAKEDCDMQENIVEIFKFWSKPNQTVSPISVRTDAVDNIHQKS